MAGSLKTTDDMEFWQSLAVDVLTAARDSHIMEDWGDILYLSDARTQAGSYFCQQIEYD